MERMRDSIDFSLQVIYDASALCELERRVQERTRELQESESLLTQAQSVAGLGVYSLDFATGLWKSSAIMDQLFGIGDSYDRSVEGWANLIHPDDRSMMMDYFRNFVIGLRQPFAKEYRIIRQDDQSERWMHGMGMLESDEANRLTKMIGTIQDITERKAVEASLATALLRAEAANQAKSQFLGVMSHELRTPLNGVLGLAELLADSALDSEQMDYVKMISSCGEHLLAIVSDILDFASIEAGTLAIHVAPLAVADLVKLAENTVRNVAVEKGVELRSELAAGAPEQIIGDELRMRQILINLLGNAVKFTAKGSVVLRVSTGSDGGEYLDFSVEDTGIGISSEDLSRLFQPFVQAYSKGSRKFGGTGLGLAISRRIAEAMGGAITASSTPGKGSLFTFRFPLESAAHRAREKAAEMGLGVPGACSSGGSK